MRITQGMLSNNILRQIQASNEKINQYQEELATGKKISKPSQDPVVATMGMGYRTDATKVDQYKRNISTANSWLDNTDAALGQASQVMQRIRELTVEGSNDTYTTDQRQSIGKEIDQLKQELASIANTKVSGHYIFNGADTATKPVKSDFTVVPNSTNTKPFTLEVNDGINIQVNADPTAVFKQSLFTDIDNLESALGTSNGHSVTGATTNGKTISSFLDKIDSHLNDLASVQADVGARKNRIEMISNRNEQQQTIATQMMSSNEDADFAKVYTELNTAESVHKAALSVGAKVMQPTLVDFLR